MSLALTGKTIVVTRAVEQADEFISQLQEFGAKVVHIPTIEIVPPDSWQACDAALEKLEQYQWVIFTSTNGVKFFINRLIERGKVTENLLTKHIAAVGERTKTDLENLGLHVDIVPEEFRAEGLVKAFKQINLQGQLMLIPKAQKSREVLINNLVSMGANVDAVAVYKNQLPGRNKVSDFQKVLNGHTVNLLTFTSPSTIKSFLNIFGERKVMNWCADGCKIAVIGEVTANTLNKHKFDVDIIPETSTIPNFIESIVEFYT